jgi:phosphonoacetate hydrolase
MTELLDVSRRGFLGTVGAGALLTGFMPQQVRAAPPAAGTGIPQRCCVVLFDGFGVDYYEKSTMPTLKRWERAGFYKPIRGVMPAVTNTNLAGINCGVHADQQGITGNSYWDADADQELFMSDGNLLTAATMFQRAGRFGVRSILVSAKQKTIPLIRQGTDLAIGSQDAPPEIVARYGKAPAIYSPDVNYWVWKVAIDLIKTRPRVGLFFVHTTDYPMHKFAPEAVESQIHLRTIDQFLAEAAQADPGMAFFIAPDHGLNSKSTVVNLNLLLQRKGIPIKVAMSAERDQYPKHHGGLAGRRSSTSGNRVMPTASLPRCAM